MRLLRNSMPSAAGGKIHTPAAQGRYGRARHGSAGKVQVETSRVPLGSTRSLVTASLLARFEAISHPRLGHDVARRRGVRLKLLAQLADEDAEIFHLFGALPPPDSSQQGTVMEDFPRTPRQVDEKIELLGSEANLAAAHSHPTSCRVDAEVSDFDHWIFIASDRHSPQIRPHSRQ